MGAGYVVVRKGCIALRTTNLGLYSPGSALATNKSCWLRNLIFLYPALLTCTTETPSGISGRVKCRRLVVSYR